MELIGICGLVGRASAYVGGDVGSIPTGGALEVWPWTFGFRTVWLVNKSASQQKKNRHTDIIRLNFLLILKMENKNYELDPDEGVYL